MLDGSVLELPEHKKVPECWAAGPGQRLGFRGYTSFRNLEKKQDDEGIFYNNVGGSEAL